MFNQFKTLREMITTREVELGRGNIISQLDIENTPGIYPVYSSSAQGTGEFGRYGKFMFDEELITWSVDGGGKPFYRTKHRFSVTNVCGYLRILAPDKWNYRYLHAAMALQHEKINFDYQTKAHPSVIQSLYNFPKIPLSEQIRIATVLDMIDDGIAKSETVIAKLKQVRSGLLHDLITYGLDQNGQLRDPIAHPEQFKDSPLGLIPKKWRLSTLGAEMPLQRGFDITVTQQRFGEIPVVSSSGIASYHDTAMVKGPGVVTGRKGKLGKAYYINGDFWPHDTSLWVTNFNGNSEKYVALLLNHLRLERFDAATSVPTLNRNTVHPLHIAVPPRREQELIVSCVELFDHGVELDSNCLIKLHSIKSGLMSDLLNGRVRVPEGLT